MCVVIVIVIVREFERIGWIGLDWIEDGMGKERGEIECVF